MRPSIVIFVLLGFAAVGLGDSPEKLQATPFGKRCGFFCMATVSGVLGEPLRYQELSVRLPSNDTGSSLDDLTQAALALGLKVKTVRFSGGFPDFASGESCAILPVRGRNGEDHFVVAVASSSGVASLVDFPNGMFTLEDQLLRRDFAWDGTALLISKSERQLDRLTQLSTRFWWWTVGSGLCFFVIALSIALRKRGSHAV